MLSTLVEGKTRWTFRFSTGAKAIGRFSTLRVRPASNPWDCHSMCEAGWYFTTYTAEVQIRAQRRCARTFIRFHLLCRETIIRIDSKSMIKNLGF
jgi:hypothetical protein